MSSMGKHKFGGATFLKRMVHVVSQFDPMRERNGQTNVSETERCDTNGQKEGGTSKELLWVETEQD